MNKFKILRKINSDLKYTSIEGYIGVEIPIDISNSGEIIAKVIKSIIEENLGVKVKSIKGNNIEGTIAKYGMIDLNFEVEKEMESKLINGIQILRKNGWIEEGNSDEYKDAGMGFLEEMITEIEENKTYLKISATIITQKEKWHKEKSYLFKQMISGEKIKPLPEDKIQVFKITDMCFTNYSGIWLWKHFYM